MNDIAATNVTVSGMTVTAGLARPGTTLINVLGFPIGTAIWEGARGYLAVNARCAAQFPAADGEAAAAQVCSQQEIHLAVQTNPAAIPESIVGAAYSTFSFGSPFDRGDPTGKEIINDCNAWETVPRRFAGTPDVAANRAAVIGNDRTFGFFPSISGLCADALELACCR